MKTNYENVQKRIKEINKNNKLHEEMLERLGITDIEYLKYKGNYDRQRIHINMEITIEEYINMEKEKLKNGYYHSTIADDFNIINIARAKQIEQINIEYKKRCEVLQERCIANEHKYNNNESAIVISYGKAGEFECCNICGYRKQIKEYGSPVGSW